MESVSFIFFELILYLQRFNTEVQFKITEMSCFI